MNTPTIVFSDVDGTLLSSGHRVTPKTRQAIGRLRQRDIPFVIVSARSPAGIEPIVRENGLCGPIVAFSGALLLDEERNVLFGSGMDRDTAAQVVRFAEGLGLDLSWCAYTARDWLVKEKADPRVIREENIVRAQSRAGRVEELAPDEAVYKVMCICALECTDAAEAALRAAFPQCSVVRSSPILIEVTRRGVNKGQAVRRLCEALGVAPEDAAAFEQWSTTLSESMRVYRVTPKAETPVNAYAYPALTPRGTGVHEVQSLPEADKALDQIRQSLIAQYGGEYDYEEFSARIAVPEGMTGYLNDENAQGDNRDTSYLMTNDFTLNSDEDFVVVYGVNHVAAGKATYANTVLYARPRLNGIVSLYDSMYGDSAAEYLPDVDSSKYYVLKMARTALDSHTAVIPYSTDNPNGRFYGADNGTQLLIAYRAYVEPETGVGPSYYEIVYDRAIVFHKK